MIECHCPGGASAGAARWSIAIVLGEFLGLEYRIVESEEIGYRLSCDGRQLSLPDSFFAAASPAWLHPSTLPKLPLESWIMDASRLGAQVGDSVPVLYGEAGMWLEPSGDAHLGLDVFGSAFFMLSRYEEVVLPDRDRHGRFPATASVASKANFLHRPIVDEYVEILWAAIKSVWPGMERKRHVPRVLVSHDVDYPAMYCGRSPSQLLRVLAGEVIRRRNIARAARGVATWVVNRSGIHAADPYNTFDWIMDVSEQQGIASAFYFICGRTHPSYDADYDVADPAIRQLLQRIHERGHEIGLHPSYNTFEDPEAIVREAQRLKQICGDEGVEQTEWGGRMHYLRWRTPTTLYGWERAGMTYDSTLGYADRPGFRCGTCREYSAFDPVSRASLKLRIRPLIAMECTVMADRYMGFGASANAFDQFIRLKDACRSVSGDFTLLWHNTELTTEAERELYRAVLSG